MSGPPAAVLSLPGDRPAEKTPSLAPPSLEAPSGEQAYQTGRRSSDFSPVFASAPGTNSFDAFLHQGLSAGLGLASGMAETGLPGLMGRESPYGTGKARINFYLDRDSQGKTRFQGEADVLWPLYDSLYTSLYTQFGVRSMARERWGGNLGIGQRWFPAARLTEDGTVDSGDWMVGYNAFWDNDLTRGHQRAGVGLETRYDWLRVGANWYFPLSGWKGSEDFDANRVRERAARGWDVRVKGSLPFYPDLAVTGSFTRWYGGNNGMFGPDRLERDPGIWSYGLEYTPVPALTVFANRQQTGRGPADTKLGLRLTYTFGMDAETQFTPVDRATDRRPVHEARHDFVDRENKVVLEYQARYDYTIDFLGKEGVGLYRFAIHDAFGHRVAWQTVHASASKVISIAQVTEPPGFLARAGKMLGDLLFVSKAWAAEVSQTYTTDENGEIVVAIEGAGKASSLTLRVGETSRTFYGKGYGTPESLTASPPHIGPTGTSTLTLSGVVPDSPVSWSIAAGDTLGALSGQAATTDADGIATALLTANGSGTGAITAQATVNGQTYSVTVPVGSLTANPARIDMWGTSSLTLTGVAANAAVTWSITAGDTLGSLSSTTDADGTGTATATLTGNGSGTGSITAQATVNGQPYTTTVTLDSSAAALTATPARIDMWGTSSLTLSGVVANAAVTWSITAGDTLGSLSSTTDADGTGTATATLTGNGSGTGSITVQATVNGQTYTTTVTLDSSAAALTASPARIDIRGTSSLTLSGVVANTVVTWSITAGDTLGSLSSMTDADGNGTATAILTGNGSGTGDITVRAIVSGQTYTTTVTLDGSAGNLTASPARIDIRGTSSLTLTGVATNAPVAWSITAGGTLGSLSSMTNADGRGTATAILTGSGSGTGDITVQAIVSGQPYTTTVTLDGSAGNLTASPARIDIRGTSSLTLTGVAASAPVSWSITAGGTLGTLSSMTNADGRGTATAILTGSGRNTGDITVQAIVSGQTYTTTVTLDGSAGNLTASPARIDIRGTSSLTLTGVATNAAVAWSITAGGTLGTLSSMTNADGRGTATAILTGSGSGTGDITVQAIVSGQTYTTTVTLDGSAGNLTASPARIDIRGTSSLTLTGVATNAAVAWSITAGGTLGSLSGMTDADGSGTATATLTGNGSSAGDITVQAAVSGQTYTTTVQVYAPPTITVDSFANGGNFVSTGYTTASLTVLVKDGSGSALSGQTVTWSVVSAQNNSPAIYSGWGSKRTGLTWGSNKPASLRGSNPPELTSTSTSTTDGNGKAVIQLTDIVGERSVTLRASVTIGGTDYTVDQALTFGDGPLRVFKAHGDAPNWYAAYQLCNGTAYPGNPGSWTGSTGYVGGGKMPTSAELQAVSAASSDNPNPAALGAVFAAGWPETRAAYWTGEAYGADNAYEVWVMDGKRGWYNVSWGYNTACRR